MSKSLIHCTQLAHATRFVARSSPLTKTNKKHPSDDECSLLSGRRGCLDLFALNVPTVFASKNFILFAKDLRTPLTGRSNSRVARSQNSFSTN